MHLVGSCGWFHWLVPLVAPVVDCVVGACVVSVVGSVVGACGWSMWSVLEIDPNASSGWLCGGCMWLVHLLGSIGWCVWLVHVVRPHGSIGRFMWLFPLVGLNGWFN